jgi:hypothetical protein
MADKKQADEKEQVSELRKRVDKKTKIAGAILAASLLCFGAYVGTDGGAKIVNSPLAQNQKERGDMPYMEDEQKQGEQAEVPQKERLDEASFVENPNLLEIHGRSYFLFDEDILLPLDSGTWEQYDIPPAEDGAYEGISEFYVKGESPSEWTQKFTIHKVRNAGSDCFEFADKLVNGIIATVKENMAANDQSFSPDNIAINYVKKDGSNTLFFWEKKNIPDEPDETQFVRVFTSKYSHQMYLATYTIRKDVSKDDIDEATRYMKTLNSIQELLAKESSKS